LTTNASRVIIFISAVVVDAKETDKIKIIAVHIKTFLNQASIK
jgi:hypothetical protein